MKVGSGPHLYFLHGFCEDSSIWEPLVSELSSSYTCILIDLPGFGGSSHLTFTSIPDVADAIHSIIERDTESAPILFGHSLGGYIVAEYMNKYRDDLRAAGLIHSSAAADTDAKRANRAKSVAFIEKNGTAEFFRVFVPGLVALRHRARLRDHLVSMVQQTRDSSVLAGLRAMAAREDRCDGLASFGKPVLLLHGEADKHYEKRDIYHQASLPAVAQLSLLPDVGHLSMLEDTKKCLAEVSRFLDLVDAL